MTTPDPALVSLLQEAFSASDSPLAGQMYSEELLAHPRLARALAIGEAWLAAEDALPSGWSVFWLRGIHASSHWTAEAIEQNGWRTGVATAPTPEAALRALAEKIGGSR